MESTGALDMGGASTQITFAPNEEVLASFFPLFMGGSFLPLFTHSNLNFGVNTISKRISDAAIRSSGFTNPVTHPCWPSGFLKSNVSYSGSVSGAAPDALYTLVGSSDYDGCRLLVAPLM
jgi:hypothetical protein